VAGAGIRSIEASVTLQRCAATWRSGYAAACKAVYTGSIPVVALSAIVASGSSPPRSRRTRRVPQLDAQLCALEKAMRAHAMVALATGNGISGSDLDALLRDG
jgi:hypothetical protein